MIVVIKKSFVILSTIIVSTSIHIKCMSLSNQKYMTQPTLINSHPNGYSQELLFAVNQGRCAGSWNTLDDLSSKVCVPNETKDLNLHAFNMITGISNQKQWEKIYQSDVNVSLIEGNNNKCWCECKNPKEHRMCEKKYIWNPATCSCKNCRHVWRMVHDSVIMCDEIIKETKTIPTETVLT